MDGQPHGVQPGAEPGPSSTRQPSEPRFFPVFMRYWLPVLVYITLIVTVSAQPNLQPPVRFQFADKVYHMIEYLGLGVLLARAMRASLAWRRALLAAFLAITVGVAVGASDEYFQSFVPGRESSVFDLLADTSGLALAQLLYLAFGRD